MCGHTADWNNRRATPSANDEVREERRRNPDARRHDTKQTMVFVIVLAAFLRLFFPEYEAPACRLQPLVA
ncbi:hypothetical protein D7S89_09000 [Trinickia fusca]|uniref:Uncharacterized protein n=1 Tax=Trinickia fusca TaxID=2419777 RepID=A0A494XKB5_9BURK|nr:hypothetical protein D7S89_09000 [Trinickia fusca]